MGFFRALAAEAVHATADGLKLLALRMEGLDSGFLDELGPEPTHVEPAEPNAVEDVPAAEQEGELVTAAARELLWTTPPPPPAPAKPVPLAGSIEARFSAKTGT